MKTRPRLFCVLIILITLALLSQSLLPYAADANARPNTVNSGLNRETFNYRPGDSKLPDPVLFVAMSTIERGLNGVAADQKTQFDRIFDGLLEKYPDVSRTDLQTVVSTWKHLSADAKAEMNWQRLLAISLGPQQERQRPIIPPQRRIPPPNQRRPESEEVKSRVRPLTIHAGSVTRVPVIDTTSPYFSSQVKKNLGEFTLTLIEADYWNHAYNYFHAGTGGENRGPSPQGVDQLEVVIDKAQQDFKINFRYSTGERNVTGGLWQVSRFPFPNDPAHWQNVPGLVATGQVIDESVQADGFHYFRINFARVANQIPGSKPYFEGTASLSREGPGVLVKPVIPAQPPPPGTRFPEAIRRPPVAQTPPPSRRSSTPGQAVNRARFAFRYRATDTDQIFYVRVIPMHAGNKGGLPALPVEITVTRPHPCPKVSGDKIVRPPSAQILWYMRPNFFNNAGSDRWYVVHGAGTPNGNPFLPHHGHMKDPKLEPEEKAWYEKVSDAFGDIAGFFSDMMTAFSVTLDMLENVVVDLTAEGLSCLTTACQYKCDENCKGFLKAGLQAVMIAYGIPPTLPTGPELFSLSEDYLIKLGADEIGAGELLAMYQALPDDVKDAMKSKANDIAGSLMEAQSNAQEDNIRKATCVDIPDPMNQSSPLTFCAARIPDPIFNSIHPATVMVYLENPNGEPTDAMKLTVTDSMRLYRQGAAIVPSLDPGESLSIPVVLAEDTQQFLKRNGGKCLNPEEAVTIQGEPPCPVLQWRDRFWQQGAYDTNNNKQADTFRVTFSMKLDMSKITGLDDRSSGKSLQTLLYLDPQAAGGSCTIPGTLRYPQGWKIMTRSRSVVPEDWDQLFTGGNGGNSINGMLRNKP